MAVFDMLRDQLHFVLWGVGAVIQAKVSLDRVSEFLNKVRHHHVESRSQVLIRA